MFTEKLPRLKISIGCFNAKHGNEIAYAHCATLKLSVNAKI